MTDDSTASSSAKVKFGFAKKLDPKVKPTIHTEPVQSSKSVEFITTVEDSKIVSRNGAANEPNGDLVIPLIRKNKWAVKSASNSTSNKAQVVLTAEDKAAAAEILADVEKLQNIGEVEDSSLEIPLWMLNRIPQPADGSEEKLNVEMHASESTLEDYEQIPVEKYGLAMLRGMGWKAEEGIGKTNKQVTKPLEVNIRPRGLGLGAVPVKEKKKEMEKEAADSAEKKLAIGSYVEVTQGREQGRVGKVTTIDRLTERWTITLVGEEKRTVSVLEINLREISEKEYKKAGKYLNNDRYHEYKLVQDEKLSRIRQEVHEEEDRREKRRNREVRVKKEDTSDGEEQPRWEEPDRPREDRERSRKRKHDRSERRKRSRTRSPTPERRRRK